MELNSTADISSKAKPVIRSFLSIDLNEVPASASFTAAASPRDALAVVRTFHERLTPVPGDLACLPVISASATCSACRLPEPKGTSMVCDGCERGFHLRCIAIAESEAGSLEEWICGECVHNGTRSQRWQLGASSSAVSTRQKLPEFRLVDMNAFPYSDCEIPQDSSLSSCFSKNYVCATNGFGGLNVHDTSSDPLTHEPHSDVTSQDVETSVSHEKLSTSKDVSVKMKSRDPREVYMESLKDFISERRGTLGEGWRAEFDGSLGGREVIYRSPDGSTHNSMSDIAAHLGLASKCSSLSNNNDAVQVQVQVQRRFNAAKRRRLDTKSLSANGLFESKESILARLQNDDSSHDHQYMDFSVPDSTKNNLELSTTNGEACPDLSNVLPIQFEDFYILSLGRVDTRPSYHDDGHIWPVGFKSCWHDKVTGSLFSCAVLDGGDAGPLFTVSRSSCSDMSISSRSVIVYGGDNRVGVDGVMTSVSDHEDEDIREILSDVHPPTDTDVFSCLNGHACGEEILPPVTCENSDSEYYSFESRSVSAVWEMVSQKMIDVRRGTFTISNRTLHETPCKHWNTDARNCHVGLPPSLSKFRGSLGSGTLHSWIDEERFGVDAAFVQEMIEHLPGVRGCLNYTCLKERIGLSTAMTIRNHCLSFEMKIDDAARVDLGPLRYLLSRRLPGRPVSMDLPRELVSDVLQVWEFVGRFHEVLGLGEALSLEAMEKELMSPCVDDESEERTGTTLAKVHGAFLKVLVGELQSRVGALVNQNTVDVGETKSRRGRKKDVDTSVVQLHTLPVNELTWLELARRYLLAFQTVDECTESGEFALRESMKIFRCLHGDGGVLCGSLDGVSGMEMDALFLAESGKQVFGSLNREGDTFTIEETVPDEIEAAAAVEDVVTANGNGAAPEWAVPLEPVRKLPTNVGTRIRKCVYEALERDPPDWARRILEHSISKEVYKGNASGPTKKAVLSVLAEVQEGVKHRTKAETKRTTVVVVSDLVMKQCRIVLRRSASADHARFFCNLLGRKLTNYGDGDDKGILGSPGMVSRPLDLRTVDLRLAAGSYNGSHEAFLEDVREVWKNIRTAFVDRPDFLELADALSQNFEKLYAEEVVRSYEKLIQYGKTDSVLLSPEVKKEIHGMIEAANAETPKAPWDEGVCKVCGVDRDDDSVLLCDTCDSEYHTYCLDPPLIQIPDGNWYCPACAAGGGTAAAVRESSVRRPIGGACLDSLSSSLEHKDYSELSVEERTRLLKFLSEELLNSTVVRQHLECCADKFSELHQKLRCLSSELKNSKVREQILLLTSKPDEEELRSTRHDLSVLQDSINVVELQMLKLSVRSEFLGRDADDRLYWVVGKPRRKSRLLVDESQNRGTASLLAFESNEEIEDLIRWTRDNDERELTDAIVHWKKSKSVEEEQDRNDENPPLSPHRPTTAAAAVLEARYGPTRRCDCLEPIWVSRPHCASCHKTFHTDDHLRDHDKLGGCFRIRRDDDVGTVATGAVVFDAPSSPSACPFEFDRICSLFTVENSNRDLVREIGLIGSSGEPSLITPPCSDDIHEFFPRPSGPGSSCSSRGRDDGNSARDDGRIILLKRSLLDMDAALPPSSLRPSKSGPGLRVTWREFVKSAATVEHVARATVVLEDSIRAENLRKWWWYWSVMSSASSLKNVSALALRVYSLDTAIVYEKSGSRSSSSSSSSGDPSSGGGEVDTIQQPLLPKPEHRRPAKRRKESQMLMT